MGIRGTDSGLVGAFIHETSNEGVLENFATIENRGWTSHSRSKKFQALDVGHLAWSEPKSNEVQNHLSMCGLLNEEL